jgi:hypothetical protein
MAPTAQRQRYTSSEAAGAFLVRGGLQGYEGEVEKESSQFGPIDTCFPRKVLDVR